MGDVLVESLLHQGDTALVHRLTVWQETLLQSSRHAAANIEKYFSVSNKSLYETLLKWINIKKDLSPGETLKQREKILVFVFKHVPLLNQRRHQQVDILWLVEVVTHAVRQSSNGIVPEHNF